MTTETTEVIEQTPEQQTQEAEAGFAAGFAKVRGNQSEIKSEAKEVTPSAPEKSDAEKASEAKAKAEADAKVLAEKEWEGVPKVVRDKLQALDALPGTVSKLAGHIGGLTNATSRIEAALKAAKSAASSAGGSSPTEQQVQAAISNPEAWKQLKEDFPEWAGPVEAEFAALRAEIAKKGTPVSADEITQKLSASFAPQLQEVERRAREFAKVDIKHEDWEQTVNTPEFVTWLRNQSPEVMVLADSALAKDAIKLLDGYTAYRQQVADSEATRLKKEKRLASAVTPQGSGEPQTTGISDQEAFAAGFNRVRKLK